ncbi:hypothetical protein MNBD_GAMMA12-1413 [hydrothermal vent metagenome]|uniref:Uncharacterized protein n=1 Tax=hydrothermal vent metagenome TaxID=652676 RepID=A0A3B0YB07_9ZZZZ
MRQLVTPGIGTWYKNEAGDLFEVVAWDQDDGCIEIQHFDGTIEELDSESWRETQIAVVAPPEDWSGSYDIQREDYGVDLDYSSFDGNHNPLDEFEQ